MAETAATEELTVVDYLRPIWRFKLVVIVVVVLAAASVYVYSSGKSKIYQASTQIYVGQSALQQALDPAAVQTDRNVTDEATLVTTPSIAVAVQAYLNVHGVTAPGLLKAVTATPSASADFMTITAQYGSPSLTARIANGFAQIYLRSRRNSFLASALAALAQARRQLAAANRLSNNSISRQSLQQEIATLQADVLTPPSLGQQVSSAPVPTKSISPKPARDAVFAGVIALVLCLIASYLVDRTDRRVRRLEDVETLFDLPVLATIPHARVAGRSSGSLLREVPVDLEEPIRTLRVNLDLARTSLRGGGKVIMVTSALPEEGKSTMVHNLALSYWAAGARVVALEADLRHPVMAERLGLDSSPGLSEALDSGSELHLQRIDAADGADGAETSACFQAAVGGEANRDPTSLLTRERMLPLLTELAQDNDIVLVDSTPLLSVSDCLPLLGLVDGLVVVVRAGKTTYTAAQRLRQTVERLHGAAVLGVVANNIADELASYGNAYGYGYRSEVGKPLTPRSNPEADVTAS